MSKIFTIADTPEFNEATNTGQFPGLVIDHRLDHRELRAICGDWLKSFPAGGRRIPLHDYPTSTPDPKEVNYVSSQQPDRSLATRALG